MPDAVKVILDFWKASPLFALIRSDKKIAKWEKVVKAALDDYRGGSVNRMFDGNDSSSSEDSSSETESIRPPRFTSKFTIPNDPNRSKILVLIYEYMFRRIEWHQLYISRQSQPIDDCRLRHFRYRKLRNGYRKLRNGSAVSCEFYWIGPTRVPVRWSRYLRPLVLINCWPKTLGGLNRRQPFQGQTATFCRHRLPPPLSFFPRASCSD
jgi:hypothetical protein